MEVDEPFDPMAIALLGTAALMAGAQRFAKLVYQLGLGFAAGKDRLPSGNFLKVRDVACMPHITPLVSHAKQDCSTGSGRDITFLFYIEIGDILQLPCFKPPA